MDDKQVARRVPGTVLSSSEVTSLRDVITEAAHAYELAAVTQLRAVREAAEILGQDMRSIAEQEARVAQEQARELAAARGALAEEETRAQVLAHLAAEAREAAATLLDRGALAYLRAPGHPGRGGTAAHGPRRVGGRRVRRRPEGQDRPANRPAQASPRPLRRTGLGTHTRRPEVAGRLGIWTSDQRGLDAAPRDLPGRSGDGLIFGLGVCTRVNGCGDGNFARAHYRSRTRKTVHGRHHTACGIRPSHRAHRRGAFSHSPRPRASRRRASGIAAR